MPHRRLMDRIQNWILTRPVNCIFCDEWSSTEVCFYCESDLARIAPVNLRAHVSRLGKRPNALRAVLAPFWYTQPMPRFLSYFKFQGYRHYARVLTPAMSAHIVNFYGKEQLLLPEVLVPVPMLASKEVKRGYNQAALISESLGEILGIPVENWVRRIAQRTESHKSTFATRELINHEFEFFDYFANSGAKRIALVDDVVTTGATLLAVRNAIPAQNIIVDGWAAAFTPPPSFRTED